MKATYTDLRNEIQRITAELVERNRMSEFQQIKINQASNEYIELDDAARRRGHQFVNGRGIVPTISNENDTIEISDEQELMYIAEEFIKSEIQFVLFPV